MRFSRRNPARTADAVARGNGDAPAVVADERSPTEVAVANDSEPPAPTATTVTGAPTVPMAAPSAHPPSVPSVVEQASASDGEPGDADLDQFFAALRQVVRDAREQVADGTGAMPTAATQRVVGAPEPADELPPSSLVVPSVGQGAPAPGAVPELAAELAPTTTELVASLEADRDLWRERAIVWRERAMGADMLVKTLNAHMSDLKLSLDDLRLAMRVLSNDGTEVHEPRAELPAANSSWSGLDHLLEPGT